MKILIVDDDTGLTQLLQLVFESRGFWVTTAYDGEQALKALEKELPEAIVLDLMMPGVGGLEVCKLVRKDPRTAHIPIIILSAMPNESAHQDAMDAGATEYLIKPIRPSDLIKRIREVTAREEASTVQVLM